MATKEFNMDLGWRFKLDDEKKVIVKDHSGVYYSNKSGVVAGIPGKDYADNDWQLINIPHDYYIGIGFDENNVKPQGYHNHSDAWYRKTFLLESSETPKSYNLVFEGIAGKSRIYFNGFYLGETQSSYTENIFDITDYVYTDSRLNVLVVNIDGSFSEGWWYEGAGIYRHVKLYVKELTHIAYNGIFAKPSLINHTENDWKVDLSVEVNCKDYENSSVYTTAELLYNGAKISSYKSNTVLTKSGAALEISGDFKVENPNRWDIDSPNLYELKVTLWQDNTELDTQTTKIGFRTISADPNHGIFLNGKKVLIKGTCNHQDHAGVGVALADSLHYWRVKKLKEMGTNTYRCAHNMHAKEILDACDELGMLVMDENRHFGCDDISLSQVENMIKRDRNHPSIIFWSMFNEEPLQSTQEGARIFKRMKQFTLNLDDSRFVVGAINGQLEGTALEMDVAGLNYFLNQADIAHEKYPDMVILGSENNSAVTTRGCYKSDKETAHILSNYDEEIPMWGSTIRDMWRFVREREYFAGILVWTGFDYRGEPTPFDWPSVSSQFGILDTCGFEKDAYYYHKACFTSEPMVHLLPHWTWKVGDTVRTVAVTNCDEVELILNGKSLGKKAADVCAPPEWMIEFETGEIVAKAYKNGVLVAEDKHITAGEPKKIELSLNNSSVNNCGQDMVLVNARVVDENGVLVPDAENLVTFSVEGDGYVRGTGNGNPNSHEDDTKPYRLAFHGLCQAVVLANEDAKYIKVIASGDGLISGEIEIPIESVSKPNYIRSVQGTTIGGFTLSDKFVDRPDPLMEIADNDMNTFTPFIVPAMGHQRDFNNGWRIYRTSPSLPKSNGKYELYFPEIKGHIIEVYINGEMLAKESYPTGNELTIIFDGKENEKAEIRILIFAEENYHGCGLSKFVSLKGITQQKNLLNTI